MSKSWFRKNHQSENPARIAEAHNVVARQDAYDRAKEATVHLLIALKQWPGFDSTGNINGVIDHTLVNIDRLDDALDELRDQIDKLRGQQVAEMVQRSGHPSMRSPENMMVQPSGQTIRVTLGGSMVATPKSVADQVTKKLDEVLNQKGIVL
ncbi:hypothetical protein [Glutamicibacter sp. NPDC090743]|uniref:hypothetical protein n=1 Tax=Glutamicibacter sp. NPDC090743 TaxID=3364001 RepID=UPI00382A8ECE